MNTIGHSKFILTPVMAILEDTNRACQALVNGIEIQPLSSYIMQTTFLRMTGASEQKLKCINWELASFDYDFRYMLLKNPPGECSSYEDKAGIYANIRELLKSRGINCDLEESEKDSIIDIADTQFLNFLEQSSFSQWCEKEFHEYKKMRVPIQRSDFGGQSKKQLLGDSFRDYYKNVVYRQRNRYAHNLTSYQLNIPTLTQLSKTEEYDRNHFRMFSILILLDEIFMTLFRKFESYKSEHTY